MMWYVIGLTDPWPASRGGGNGRLARAWYYSVNYINVKLAQRLAAALNEFILCICVIL